MASREMARPIRPPHPNTVLLALSKDCERDLFADRDEPSMVYVVDVAADTTLWSFHPQASSSLVRQGAFHPCAAYTILLGFQDGTIAAYKRRGLRSVDNGRPDFETQEVGSLRNVHPATIQRDSIIDAAFLLSNGLRAVTIAKDGLCRLVDFSRGGRTLRCWRPMGLPMKLDVYKTEADCVIAVACDTGSILLYNALGLLQCEIRLPDTATTIIGLQWYDGVFPASVRPTNSVDAEKANVKSMSNLKPLQRHDSKLSREPMVQTRRFAVHPDEMQHYGRQASTSSSTTSSMQRRRTTALASTPSLPKRMSAPMASHARRLASAAASRDQEEALATLHRASRTLDLLAAEITAACALLV